MGTHNPKEYLTQREAAGLLRISERTLERWRLEGGGPSFRKFGRRVVYAAADLADWSADRRVNSTSETARK